MDYLDWEGLALHDLMDAFSPWEDVAPSYVLYLVNVIEHPRAESDGYDTEQTAREEGRPA